MKKLEKNKNTLSGGDINTENEAIVDDQLFPKHSQSKSPILVFAVLLVVVGLVIATIILLSSTVSIGAEKLMESYQNGYETEKETAYLRQYEKFYKRAEEEYHVMNRVSIDVGELKETANLEVLKVSDIEYITIGQSDNKEKITSWLEVPGEGTFVVNLQTAEFIIDNEHRHVTVRVSYPELTNITIDYKNIKKMLFKNDILNDSYKVGEDLARSQLNSADILIKKEFASNQHFYLSAQKAAQSTIIYLVNRLNPDVTNLSIDVEFI